MSTLDDITAERQRIAEQLARIDAERTKLAEQLADLEATERVLARFTQPLAATHPGRRRTAKSTGPAPRRRQRGTGGSAAAKPALALGLPHLDRRSASLENSSGCIGGLAGAT